MMKVKFENSLEFQLQLQLPASLGIQLSHEFTNHEFAKGKRIRYSEILDAGRSIRLHSSEPFTAGDTNKLTKKLLKFLLSKI